MHWLQESWPECLQVMCCEAMRSLRCALAAASGRCCTGAFAIARCSQLSHLPLQPMAAAGAGGQQHSKWAVGRPASVSPASEFGRTRPSRHWRLCCLTASGVSGGAGARGQRGGMQLHSLHLFAGRGSKSRADSLRYRASIQ